MGPDIAWNMGLPFIAETRGDSLSLVILMDIQMVQISGFVYVPKTQNLALCNGY